MLSLIASFFGLSGLYVLLEAPFVAVVQIIIYAGAIMVLFLFVGDAAQRAARGRGGVGSHRIRCYRPVAVRIGARAGACCWRSSWAGRCRAPPASAPASATGARRRRRCAELGRVLFTDYMFAFEVTSILIIVAMVGAVVLARKRED